MEVAVTLRLGTTMRRRWAIAVRHLGALALLSFGLNAVGVNANVQAQPQVPKNPRTDDDTLVRAGLERVVAAHIVLYRNDNNATNKSFHDWTAEDLRQLPDVALPMLRSLFYREHYDLVDQILPRSMNREEFGRAILRESARRGLEIGYYNERFDFNRTEVEVRRPLNVPSAEQVNVRISPSAITARDAAIDFLNNPRQAAMVVKPDVVAQTGPHSAPGLGITAYTDAAAYDLGYTVGAHPDFHRSGRLPIGVRFEESEEQVKAFYCWASKEIFARQGRSLDQAQAFAIGFVQGRTDAKSLSDTSIPLVVLGPCPKSPPAVPPLNPVLLDLLRPSGAPMSGKK